MILFLSGTCHDMNCGQRQYSDTQNTEHLMTNRACVFVLAWTIRKLCCDLSQAYNLDYPAPGEPALAARVASLLRCA